MKIETKQINILGSLWTIKSATDAEEPRFEKENCDGFCDCTTKEIVIKDRPAEECTIADIPAYIRCCLRHEITHAFLRESGLWHNATGTDAWPMNEEMIDWIAIQHEKLHDAFRQAGALDQDDEVIPAPGVQILERAGEYAT